MAYRLKNDLVGTKQGRLTVLERISKNGRGFYKCLCECGKETIVRADGLKSGRIKSCGCLLKDIAETGEHRRTHGQRWTKLYNVWLTMKSRCNNKNVAAYKNYGGRGVNVCKEWADDYQTFYNWAMANGYNETLTIDRIDVNGNYEPNNCRWVTRKEQANNKRNNVKITFNNVTHTLNEWATITGIDRHIISWRLKHKWTIERTLTTQPKKTNS